MEAYSRDHCCSGKAISIAYSECMFLALGNQHAMRMWPVQPYNIFSHYLTNGKIFEKKINVKYMFYFLYKFYLKRVLF